VNGGTVAGAVDSMLSYLYIESEDIDFDPEVAAVAANLVEVACNSNSSTSSILVEEDMPSSCYSAEQ
jgi:hypothetical protein